MSRPSRPELAAARLDGAHPIGSAARLTGISAKMIRHFEAVGLLRPTTRSFANYRLYGAADLDRLRFIRRGRDLGFSIAQIGELLSLWDDPQRSSEEVKRLAKGHVAALGERIAALQAMQRSLQQLAERCHGDARPDCPILEDLAQPGPSAQR